MLRTYFVSAHFFLSAAQTSKHKERAFCMTVEAFNNYDAAQTVKPLLREIGAKRIVQIQASLI